MRYTWCNYSIPKQFSELFVKMVPTPEFTEKLGDVHIVAERPTIKVDGSIMDLTKTFKSMTLTKKNSYQSNLFGQIIFDDLNFEEIDIEVLIYLINNTLEIIKPVEVPPCSVVQDFRKLMAQNEEESKKKLCDVKIACTATTNADETTTSYAHKAILASRSPVFATMFTNNMKESATNTVSLVDIEPDVLKDLLTYIYCGECPNIKTHAESLLYQAEKYELSHLKSLCEEQLSYDIQIENAVRILLLADRCNAKQLKRNSLLFIIEHGDQVRETEEWGEVKKSCELLTDLFDATYDHEPAAKRPKTN